MPRLIMVVGTPGVARLLRDAADRRGAADKGVGPEVTPAQIDFQRGLATRLADATRRWNTAHADRLPDPILPEVVSDLWYLQHALLQTSPTLCIGGTDVNMLARLWARGDADTRGEPFDIRIHRDAEWTDLRGVIEGRTSDFLSQAVDLFIREDLDGLLTGIATQVPPD